MGADLNVAASDAQSSSSVSAEMVRSVLPDFDQVSLTVLDDAGALSTCAHAGDLAPDLDQLQYDLGEGPTITVLRDADTPVVAPFIRRDNRWQRYVSSAAGLGLRSQITTPLWHEDNLLGALNMYSTTRTDVAATAPLMARAFAAQIAGTLASRREIENLHRALATRKTIGVALGMLMGQYDLTEEAAFAVLRRRSSHSNVKLRVVAERMVAERSTAGLDLPSVAHG